MGRQFGAVQPLLASAARNVDGQSSFFKVSSASFLRFFVDITAIDTGSLQIYIEGSPDGTTPYILSAFQPLSSVRDNTNSGLFTEPVTAPPKYIRIRYVISGGGTITFSASMVKIEQG